VTRQAAHHLRATAKTAASLRGGSARRRTARAAALAAGWLLATPRAPRGNASMLHRAGIAQKRRAAALLQYYTCMAFSMACLLSITPLTALWRSCRISALALHISATYMLSLYCLSLLWWLAGIGLSLRQHKTCFHCCISLSAILICLGERLKAGRRHRGSKARRRIIFQPWAGES